jgi:hypothetical protein
VGGRASSRQSPWGRSTNFWKFQFQGRGVVGFHSRAIGHPRDRGRKSEFHIGMQRVARHDPIGERGIVALDDRQVGQCLGDRRQERVELGIDHDRYDATG